MPFQDVILQPGVDVEKTFELNMSGVSVSNLIRYKEGLIQKIGGWQKFTPTTISSSPVRDVHAFAGLLGQKWLAAGSQALLQAYSASAAVYYTITPQFTNTTPTPSFSISSGTQTVTIIDPGSALTTYDMVRFDTPIAVSNLLLNGAYQVIAVLSSNEYQITSSVIANTTVSSGGILPAFYTTAGSAIVDVVLPNNNFVSLVGLFYPFRATTSVGGLTIQGPYQITSVIDATHFQITANVQSTTTLGASQAVSMNGGNVAFHYYNVIGPPATFGPYGAGNYGANAYGIGTVPPSGTGTAITPTDWILDNWGETLIACPVNEAIYTWSADTNLSTAEPIVQGNAPLFNTGAFVSQPQQILMAWGSVQFSGQQDPLIVRWSDAGNYNQWVVATNTAAGSFHIPTGSKLVAGLQAPLYAVFWTDIDVWIAQYIGQPLVYSFTRVGTGCGAVGPHAADVNAGNVYWCGFNNFFMLGPNGVMVLPCTVWDYFFQQVDQTNIAKVRCASNSVFNEITWFFPVIGGNGENSNYVKVHIEGQEYEWDYGVLSRTAWVDVTALGFPIATDVNGNIFQHEMTNDAAGSSIDSYFESGWFAIGDGTQLSFVDWILPDMKWAFFGSSSTGTVIFTFYTVDYPGDTQRSYGPFAVTQNNEFINVRMRGRFFRVRVESQDLGSFWRIGKIKFRWAPMGRR
jgi:hypothetical protein